MILVVDDDRSALEQIQLVLQDAGYEVVTTDQPQQALAIAHSREPALIMSDVMMPEMDGFGFREAYLEQFPGRSTPFVFLSSMSDDASVVRGLDLGADDYLIKPASKAVLLAKIRGILRRQLPHDEVVFEGSLEALPFPSLMRFCELKALTGIVSVRSGSLQADVKYRAGELVLEGDDDKLGELLDLTSGTFIIRSMPAGFDDVDGISRTSQIPAPAALRLAGRLSTVKVGKRHLQVQTEWRDGDQPTLITLVTVDGKTFHKRVQQVASSADLSQDFIDQQHHQVEGELAKKVEAARETLNESPEDRRVRFNRLFDEGYELIRKGQLQQAIDRWEAAQKLDPDNSTVRVNLNVAREKLRSKK